MSISSYIFGGYYCMNFHALRSYSNLLLYRLGFISLSRDFHNCMSQLTLKWQCKGNMHQQICVHPYELRSISPEAIQTTCKACKCAFHTCESNNWFSLLCPAKPSSALNSSPMTTCLLYGWKKKTVFCLYEIAFVTQWI